MHCDREQLVDFNAEKTQLVSLGGSNNSGAIEVISRSD